MAKKRHVKRRKGTKQKQKPQGTQKVMSTSDPGSLEGRSSDGTGSNSRDSEDVRTEITSLMETDSGEGAAGDIATGPVDEADRHDHVEQEDNRAEVRSLYAASRYPRVHAAHRVEMPYYSLRREAEYDDATMTSTRSLYAQDLDYVMENGRRYCGDYYMPNDDKEQDRLRLIHQIYLHTFDRQLTSVPLEDPEEILDVGTGTGEWAIGMADLYPDCTVTGVDISAIQPTAVPQNVFFEIDDMEVEWDRGHDRYDLIHMRNMAGAFRDWRFIYSQAYSHLKPGGWIELLDFDDREGFKKFFSVFPPDSDLHVLAKDLYLASLKAGRNRGVAHMDPRLLMEAGFIDIKTSEYLIPINVHSEPRDTAGKIWLAACLAGFEALCLRPLTKDMGWDPEKVKRMCENAAKEMKRMAFDKERSKGLLIKARVVVGRKPEGSDGWTTAQSFGERSPMSETFGDDVGDMRDELMSDDWSAPPDLPEVIITTVDDEQESRADGDVLPATTGVVHLSESEQPLEFSPEASQISLTSSGVSESAHSQISDATGSNSSQ